MADTLYHTILIDPPWPEHGGGKIKRGADRHYSLLSTRDIPRVIWTCPMFRPAENAHLYLWTTNNYLPNALALIALLDFRYINKLTWCKDHIGIGQYWRGETEDLLFAVRGKGLHPSVCTDAKNLGNLIVAGVPRGLDGKRIHSRKPEAAYKRIEARSKGPRLEIFARIRREGWDAWGNEV